LLADNYPAEDIRDILSTGSSTSGSAASTTSACSGAWLVYAPAFGLAGSVIGLVGLLYGLGDTGDICATSPSPWSPPLYGILAAFFVFSPMAECIRDKTEREVLTHRLIIVGAVAIKNETNPHYLREEALRLLTPADPAGNPAYLCRRCARSSCAWSRARQGEAEPPGPRPPPRPWPRPGKSWPRSGPDPPQTTKGPGDPPGALGAGAVFRETQTIMSSAVPLPA
jgi:chemotaxis protein MotA